MTRRGPRVPACSGVRVVPLLGTFILMGWGLMGCTRGLVPIIEGGALLPSTLTAAAGVTRTPIYLFTPGPGYQFPHAVFGIPEGNSLTVRQVAGVSGGDLGELEFDRRGLILTGGATNLGSSTWVEIIRPSGGSGWVSAAYLTQDVPPDAFCADPRVPPLVETLRNSIAGRDASALQPLIDPRRGLTVRIDWRNPEVAFGPSQLPELFTGDESRSWGTLVSGGAIRGPFKEVILPRLDQVAQGNVSPACNETLIGPTLREARWPSEYTNLNYYALYRPAETAGSEYAWSTWLVGIEYVDNQPYVSHLVQLRAGI